MVPFAEVILLTAMEYHREDSQCEHRNILMPLNVREEEGKDDSKENKFQLPKLKTLGAIHKHLLLIYGFNYC